MILISQTQNLVKYKAGNLHINVSLKLVHITIVAVGKKLNITFSECLFVAVVIQHAMRMRRIIFSSVASQATPYFSTLFKKTVRFLEKKKDVEHKICVLIVYTTFVCNVSHSKENSPRYSQ